MGYTTNFDGQFNLTKPLLPEHMAYLEKFNETRRMVRDARKAEALPDPVRQRVGLPIGKDGAYFVGGTGLAGQDRDSTILDYNQAPSGQPGLWCQWRPDSSGTAIVWDGGEKFYDYTEWLRYLIDSFLKPWGYVLNGEVTWQGEDSTDIGKIVVTDNAVVVKPGRIVYEE